MLVALAAVLSPAAPALAARGEIPEAEPRLDPGAPQIEVTIGFHGLRDGFGVPGRRLLAGSTEVYLPSSAMATIFRAGRYWQESLRRLTVRARGNTFRLTAGSRLIDMDGRAMLLRTPPLAVDGDLWLPVEFMLSVMGPTVGEMVAWDPAERELTVGSSEFNVTGLRISTQTRSTLVRLSCTEPLGWRADTRRRDLIVLKIYGGEVDRGALTFGRSRGLVRGVEARQYSDHAKVYVRISDLVGSFRTYSAAGGREIVLALEENVGGALPDPQPHGHVNMAASEAPRDVTLPVRVRTVVLDPGHGGGEPGRVGPDGTLEKEINLKVARELEKILEKKGLRVVLTREQDRLIGLDERAEAANRAGGDIFVSIHANGWFNGEARGIETYFLDPAGGFPEGEEPGLFLPWEQVQERHLARSSDLAEILQAALVARTGAFDRGVRRGGYRVLRSVDMPAVLVEMGFLSNRDEERKLNDKNYRRRLAEAMAEALLTFRERYEGTVAEEEER